tara:strand:+ start:220 stop:528 length:309 start_codon:yes stop_codon:yes gene_type:complete
MKSTNQKGKTKRGSEREYWLDSEHNVAKVYWAVVIVCAILFLLDAFYEKHPYFEFEKLFGFYGLYGFVACVGLVIAAKGMRKLLIREETYYEDRAEKPRGKN